MTTPQSTFDYTSSATLEWAPSKQWKNRIHNFRDIDVKVARKCSAYCIHHGTLPSPDLGYLPSLWSRGLYCVLSRSSEAAGSRSQYCGGGKAEPSAYGKFNAGGFDVTA
jgi:hypothetical protein